MCRDREKVREFRYVRKDISFVLQDQRERQNCGIFREASKEEEGRETKTRFR